MPKFLQTRELLCHGFKGTWQITELAISVSKNCFELCMVSKYRILTSLSQNLWNVVTLQWLISTFMLISFFLLGFCLFICLFVWGFLFVGFFAICTAFLPVRFKILSKFCVFISGGITGVLNFQEHWNKSTIKARLFLHSQKYFSSPFSAEGPCWHYPIGFFVHFHPPSRFSLLVF